MITFECMLYVMSYTWLCVCVCVCVNLHIHFLIEESVNDLPEIIEVLNGIGRSRTQSHLILKSLFSDYTAPPLKQTNQPTTVTHSFKQYKSLPLYVREYEKPWSQLCSYHDRNVWKILGSSVIWQEIVKIIRVPKSCSRSP